jgi:hypothetical protein
MGRKRHGIQVINGNVTLRSAIRVKDPTDAIQHQYEVETATDDGMHAPSNGD